MSCKWKRNCFCACKIKVLFITRHLFLFLDIDIIFYLCEIRDERESELYLQVLNATHKAIEICLKDPLFGLAVIRDARSRLYHYYFF